MGNIVDELIGGDTSEVDGLWVTVQDQSREIKKLRECVEKLSDIRNQRDLFISEFDSSQGIQDVLEYVELYAGQTLKEIYGSEDVSPNRATTGSENEQD